MSLDLKGKRILFLDGSMNTRQVVLYAKKMGIYTVVANFYDEEKAPSKTVADKTYLVDIFDTEKILDIINREKIDGIFGGFADSHLVQYAKICRFAGLPCYGSEALFEIATDKVKFKEMCKKHSVPTVKEFSEKEISKEGFAEFPLFIKPVDNAGCKGCTACFTYQEYLQSKKIALDFSKSKEITIEKYYDMNEYQEFVVYYTMHNGHAQITSMGDRPLISIAKNLAPLPSRIEFPSKYLSKYLNDVNDIVVKMIEEEGFNEGTIFFQGFASNSEICLFEMGYRQAGGEPYYFTEYFNGTNVLREALEYAVYSKCEYKDEENPYFNKPASILIIYLKEGKIASIEGFDAIEKFKEVINITRWINAGNTISNVGTLGQTLCRIHIVADNEAELNNTIKRINSTIKVIDENGNDMIIHE